MDTATIIEYKWDESMGTGDDRVDGQHRELIRQMNLLMLAMTRGEGTAQIDSLLQFLVAYAGDHFRYEEDCMNRSRCPVAQTNALAHAQFVEKLVAFRQQLAAQPHGETVLTIQVMRELSTWLMGHIRRIDTQLRKCVQPA
jgi:hemerythrin